MPWHSAREFEYFIARLTAANWWEWEIRKRRLTIKVHGAGAVGIDLLDHDVQLLVGQLVVQLAQDLAQAGGGNVAIALLVVQAESFTQLLLHGLIVLLHNEFGSQLDELLELQATRLCR